MILYSHIWACHIWTRYRYDNARFHAVHFLRSMVCYIFFMGHTANLAIKMIQVLTKISSWTQKCVYFIGILVFFKIGRKIKELFKLFEGPGEVK